MYQNNIDSRTRPVPPTAAVDGLMERLMPAPPIGGRPARIAPDTLRMIRYPNGAAVLTGT
jgi:hypothetical protein